MANAAACLSQLVEVANGDLTGQAAEEALTDALEVAHNLQSTSGWAALDGEEISALALTRALGDILKDKEAGLQGRAVALYAALLSIKDAPVGTLCEPYAFTAFMHCVRNICLPSKREGAPEGGTQQADPALGEPAAISPLAVLEDVGAFLRHHSLKGSPDMFRLFLDMLVDITGSTIASGKPEKGNKRGTGAARNQGVSVAEAAFALLPVALDARHGSLLQTAAALCHRLTPAMLGLEGAKRNGWDRRGAALNLINSLLSEHEVARPCRMALMRRLCLRTPDKAECRQMTLQAVQSLVLGCSPDEVRAFCLFLYRLSRSHKIGSRVIAVELAGALLSTMASPFAVSGVYKQLVDGSSGAGDELEAPWSAACLAIVISRSNDKSASVRGKAISVLADCVQAFAKRLLDEPAAGREASDTGAFLPALCASRQIRVQVTLPASRGAGDDSDDEDDGGPQNEAPGAMWKPPSEAKVVATIPGKVPLGLAWMRTMCHARCRDEKAAVRKVALQLLESVLELSAAAERRRPGPSAAGCTSDGPTAEDLQVLEEATADSLVSVRKAALQVVCNLVACYPHHMELACMWARSTLPLVRDPESSVQEAVLERLSVLLLEPLAVLGGKGAGARGAGRGGATAVQQQASEEVRQRLAALAQLGRAASSCLARALAALSAKKLLRGSQVAAGLEAFLSADRATAAEQRGAAPAAADKAGARRQQDVEKEREQRRAERDQREGAWMVFVEVAAQDPAAPSWQFLQRCWGELQAAGAGEASAQEGAMLLWVISHAASRFPAGDAANLTSGLLQAILGFNLPCAAVAAHLAALHKLTLSGGGQSVVGEPAAWCVRVQDACEDVLAKAMDARGNMGDTLATHCQLALFSLGEVALLRETAIGGGAAVKVQALTYSRQVASSGPSTGASATSQAAVCAQAWTCLGKLCMVDESLAKKCVPLMVQEMSASSSPMVRVNLLVGLADMIVQFTGLADAYVGRLAAMVRDPHELVRRQALALLANLLLRDFVKWRGALVHRFLLALVDESPGVRQLAQYLLSDSLASKAPMLAYNHFIESLFVLNDCSAGLHGHRAGGGGVSELASELALHSALEGGSGFHLKGCAPIMRAKRDIIYTALLRRMSPEHRFAAFAKLVAEVLGGVVDGLLPLSEADEVLGDALRLMACKDMKVNANRFGASVEEDGTVDQLTATQEDVTRARGKLVGAMMKKHLAESVVPLMVELRYMLQAQKHPLLGSLMLCMASLLRDYKSEVEDILVSDKQLALEIMHDLKHYESLAKQQHQRQAAAMAAALAPKPAASDPSNVAGTTQNNASATAAVTQVMMPPPPTPTIGKRRQTILLPGVEPSRTPIAAEVLATTTKRGGRGVQPPAQQTPAQGPGPCAAAQTPAAGLRGAAANVMRTPRTVVPGSAQRGLPGGLSVMLSPAPLSTRARVLQQQRLAGGGMAALPLAAACAQRLRHPGAAGGSADPEDRINVLLPSPMTAVQPNPGVRPLGLHNSRANNAAVDQQDPDVKLQQRTPPAMLAAAVRAARQAAAAAIDNGMGEECLRGGANVDPMDVDEASKQALEKVAGDGGVAVSIKEEPGAGGVGPTSANMQAPEVKMEADDGARGGKGRSGKRRHGAS